MGGGWLVGAKIKDQQGLMIDRVGENYEYEVRFRLKKLMKKFKKCAPNASNGAHLCPKSEDLYPKSEAIYYINVPQSEGGEKSAPLRH